MKIRKNDIFLYGRKMLFQMLEILYPRRCAVCDEIEVTGKGICPLCKDKVHVAGEPACKKCGKPLVDERKEFCTDCGKKHHVYTQGKAVFVYEGGIRNSMYRFKYGNKREYAEFYANAALEIWSVAEQNKSRSADSHSNVFPEEATARIQSGRSICAGTWKKSRDFSG